MNTNRMKQSLLIAALGVLPVANAWAQPPAAPDAPPRHSRMDERDAPIDEDDDDRRDGDERRGERRRGDRPPGDRRPGDGRPGDGRPPLRDHHRGGPDMRPGDGEYGRPSPGRHGPHHDGEYHDGERRDGEHHDGEWRDGERRDGDDRMGPPRGRGYGPDGHRGPGRFEDRDDRKDGEWRDGRRRGDYRGERGRRGGRRGEWMNGRPGERGGPRDFGRDGIGRDGRWNRDHAGIRSEGTRGGGQMTLRGTVTSVVADKSIGVIADDGTSYWARVGDADQSNFKVGQRVELTGQWENQFFVARSARAQ